MRDKVEELVGEFDTVVASQPIEGFNVKVVSLSEGLKNAIENKLKEITPDVEALTPLYVRKSQAEEGRWRLAVYQFKA